MSSPSGDLPKPSQINSTSIRQLQGPILVLGASGFIGANLLRILLEHRETFMAQRRAYPRGDSRACPANTYW
jgi:hypothetical protein